MPHSDGPDIVYIVGPGSEKTELRYSLRSLRNVDHGRVWIAGNKPDWVRNVGHIPTVQKGSKFANSTLNLRAACEHPDVPDEFAFFNDDFFAVRPTTIPNWHRGPIVAEKRPNLNRRKRQAAYRDGLAATAWLLRRWGYDAPLNYDIHAPMLINGPLMLDVLDAAASAHIEALHKRSLYGNVVGIGGEFHEDPKLSLRGQSIPDGADWASTLDSSFARGTPGRQLRALFPDPSPYEEDPCH